MTSFIHRGLISTIALFLVHVAAAESFDETADNQPLLNKQKLLDQQSFWDNRDWEWYKAKFRSSNVLMPIFRQHTTTAGSC